MNLKHSLAMVWMSLALAFAVGCGADEPPPDATLDELARLSDAGAQSAKMELNRLETAGMLDSERTPNLANGGASESLPNATLQELAELSDAGAQSAKSELNRMGSAGPLDTSDMTNGDIPPDATLDELAGLSSAGNLEAKSDLEAIEARKLEVESAMDATVVLARYSIADPWEGSRRAAAARELTERFNRGDMDSKDALDLLHDIAPEWAVSERRKAADRLAKLSEGEMTDGKMMAAANELTRLVSGTGLEVEQRVGAARELSEHINSGDVDPDHAASLLNDIAPELSISERKEAARELGRHFSSDSDWDIERTKSASEEAFRLITGVKMQPERRAGAAVELAGEGMKRFGGDQYDDHSVDVSVELIQQTISGDISVDSVSDVLNFD